MRFRTVKNGYDPNEVEQYFKRVRETYEDTLTAQRDRIFALKDELSKAQAALAEYENRKEQISKAIESALSKADEIEKLTRRKVAKELASLRRFHKRWVDYFARILRKYPLDEELAEARASGDEIARLLGEADSVPDDTLKTDTFDPVGMIEDHLAAESVDDEETFDYNAAIHPEEDLEQILHDLGIMFGEDNKRK